MGKFFGNISWGGGGARIKKKKSAADESAVLYGQSRTPNSLGVLEKALMFHECKDRINKTPPHWTTVLAVAYLC